METLRLGGLFDRETKHQAGSVWDKHFVSPTIDTMQGGYREPMIIDEPKCLNSKGGRNGIDGLQPSLQDRVYDTNGVSVAVTTSFMPGILEDKTNVYLSEKGKKYVCDPKRGMCTDINADVCQTLTAKGQSNWTGSFVSPDIDSLEKSTNIGSSEPTLIHLKDGTTITSNDSLEQYRIRKLTPLECWRLMDFTDEDFYKSAEVNSNTQLYKQAGNSIVKNVLVAILGQMIPECENLYKGIDNE